MQAFHAHSSQTWSSHEGQTPQHDGQTPLSYEQSHYDFSTPSLPEPPPEVTGPHPPSTLSPPSTMYKKKWDQKCWHCTNDRRKCEPSSDLSSCQRCKDYEYSCLLDAPGDAKRRKLSRWKCQQCRSKKQKCEPEERQWPGERCKLCVMQDLLCSEPQLATGRQRKNTVTYETSERPRLQDPLEPSLDVRASKDVPTVSNHGTIDFPTVHARATEACFDSTRVAIDIIPQVSQRTSKDCALNSDCSFDDVKSYVSGYKEGDLCPRWVLQMCIKNLHFPQSLQRASHDLSCHDYDTIDTSEKIAAILVSQERFAEAEKLYRKLISIWKLSEDRTRKLWKLQDLVTKLVTMLSHTGDYDAAIEIHENLIGYWISRCLWLDVDIDKAVKSLLTLYHQYLAQFGSLCGELGSILPLHRALELKCPKLIKAILDSFPEFKITRNAKDAKGQTILHLVSKSEIEDTIDFAGKLLEQGASLEARDSEGRTPLFVAAYYGMVPMVNFFLDRGADTVVEAQLYGSEDGIKVWWEVATPLHAAIFRGYNKIAMRILNRISDINNFPAVEDALVCACIRGLYDVVALLLDKGLAVNSRPLFDLSFEFGRFSVMVDLALIGSLCGGHQYLSRFLLERGAWMESSNLESPTALWVAVETEREDLVEILLAEGANINGFQYSGGDDTYPETPLQHACRRGWISGVRQLISKGADPNFEARKELGRTALQAACAAGHGSIVRTLLRSGANVNASPALRGGITALQAACRGGYESLVTMLLKRGADVNASPSPLEGLSAIEAAREYYREREEPPVIVEMLENAGAIG